MVRGRSGLPRIERAALVLATLAALTATASGQSSAPTSGATPAYKPHRFDEDYRYLRDPAMHNDLWDPFKFVPLGADPDTWITFGGELRGRFEAYRNPDFDFDGTGGRNGYLLRRT